MKNSIRFNAIVLAITVLIFSAVIPNESFAGNTNSLYGFTQNGVFYIHGDLIEAANGSRVEITGGFTQWKRVDMKRIGSYYVFEANTTGSFQFPQYYCFHIGSERYIPHALVDLGSPLIKPKDVKANNQGGYNFLTEPQDDLPKKLSL